MDDLERRKRSLAYCSGPTVKVKVVLPCGSADAETSFRPLEKRSELQPYMCQLPFYSGFDV
jgi:hypothetical protein